MKLVAGEAPSKPRKSFDTVSKVYLVREMDTMNGIVVLQLRDCARQHNHIVVHMWRSLSPASCSSIRSHGHPPSIVSLSRVVVILRA